MHPVRRAYWIASDVVLLTTHIGLVGGGEPAGKLLRYKLLVGQELVYKGSSELVYEGGSFRDRASWNVWVVGTNKDGSWRLVLRHATAYSQGETSEREVISFLSCDLHSDGRLTEIDSFGSRLQPHTLLPRLPGDDEQAAKGWRVQHSRLDETFHYRLVPAAAQEHVQLHAQRHSR